MRHLNLTEAAVLFAEMAEKAHHAEEHALKKAAELIERQAKEEIGVYQNAAGPFAEWAELADATKEERARLGFPENEPGLRTGQMRDSIEHTVRMTGMVGGEAHIGSNDQNLVYFELGTSKQPPRSVLGSAAFNKSHEVRDLLGDAVAGVIAGKRAIGAS